MSVSLGSASCFLFTCSRMLLTSSSSDEASIFVLHENAPACFQTNR